MTRALPRLLTAVVAAALALVAAEFGLRFVFRHAKTSGNARDYLGVGHAGPAVRVNHVGFRGRDVPPRSGAYRIAMVGDSFTWGQGIEERERFSDLIGTALGSGYEVFNFGRSGNNMPEHLDVLSQALAIHPDFVLLQLGVNDWETPAMDRPAMPQLLPTRLENILEGHSLLYDLLVSQITTAVQKVGMADTYAAYMARNLRDPNLPNAKQAYGQLGEFFDRARAAHVGAGAVLFPALDALGPDARDYPFRYLHDGTARVCQNKQVPCLDLLALYTNVADPRTLWVDPFDAHPNAIANRMAADAILRNFRSVWSRDNIRR